MSLRALAALFGALLAFVVPSGAVAQEYPARPVRIVVSVSAGGSIDSIARALAADLSTALGQPFVVENRPGANGNIAAQTVARAAPDGYTLLVTGGSTLNLNPHVLPSVPFDSQKSFAPITFTARTNLILAVPADRGVDTLQEFIALAKSRPGALNYGSAGTGSLIHIASVLFNEATGVDARHVPYKGLAPAMGDLLAGRVDYVFDSATGVAHVRSGKLKALAVVGPNRLAALPEVKTLAEHGIRGVEAASGWHGMFAPAGIPAPVLDRLNAAAVRSLQSQRMRELVASLGAEPAWSTPVELVRRLASDLERLGAVVRKIGLRKE